jgi:rhodanese-related sulfurtransferase
MFRDSQSISNKKCETKLVENLEPEEFEKKLNSNNEAILIDVRTPYENNMIRIPNSLLLDISNPYFLQQLDNLDRNKHYFLYCRSGNRSFHAGNEMLRMGFKNIYNLSTGIINWKGTVEQNIPN